MDEFLAPYLGALTEEEARLCLGCLFAEQIQPLIREVARRNVRNYRGRDWPDAVDEVEAEVLLHLTARLTNLRQTGHQPIVNLRAYVVAAVIHASFGQLRRRSPGRTRLQNRIRYLLRNDVRFALWKTAAGEPLAGLARWDGVTLPVALAKHERAVTGPLEGVLMEIFERAGGPVRLGEVVGLAADTLGVQDSEETLDGLEFAVSTAGADETLIGRQNLAWMWSELLLLPENQRVAMLLNLRDADGHGVIELLPGLGIASFREIAGAAGMAAERLAEVWNDLPLDDAAIAEMLGVTRQQVINLRKAGRDRLSRRRQNAAGNMTRNFSSDQLRPDPEQRIGGGSV